MLACGGNWRAATGEPPSPYTHPLTLMPTGLMNCPKARHFFSQLHLSFQAILASPISTDSQHQLSTVFRLLGYYSLFDIWIPGCGDEAHFSTGLAVVTESRAQLMSRCIARIVVMSNGALEYAHGSRDCIDSCHRLQGCLAVARAAVARHHGLV